MAKNYVCRLDGESGQILNWTQEDFIFLINTNDSVQFQIEAGSTYSSMSTLLGIVQNASEEVFHSGELISGHWVTTVQFSVSGSMQISLKKDENRTNPDYIVVNPRITLANKEVPLESICFQTVLSRCLGPIQEWSQVLKDQHDLGYNFFHITPIQVLGGSQSLYCIKNPNELSNTIFHEIDPSNRYLYLANVISELSEYGIGCIVDIVLNHCAYDSQFVEEHPEVCYNLENSPYLKAAYEIDKALHEFTINIINKSVKNLHNKNRIENEKDLSTIMQIIKLEILPQLSLHQYFQMDVVNVMQKFENNEELGELNAKIVEDLKAKGLEYFLRTYALIHEGEGRFLTEINVGMVWKACKILGYSRENSIKEVKKVLPVVNSYLLSRFDKHFAEILKNIEGDIRYHKLELLKFEITPSNPLVRRYFQELNNGHVVLHNGFIMGNKEVLKDFAGKENWHYFRRNVVVWADSIKLRYGNSYEDCPVLWEKMKDYVISMSRIFKGIRLDNAHGTPVQVSSFMLSAAREVNPNLYVMAELFTSDSKLDAFFVKKLGITGLVREAINATDPRSQSASIYEYGNGETSSLGKLEDHNLNNGSLFAFCNRKKLKARPVPAIYYDCTHDNPTPSEKRKAKDALPCAALLAMTNCTIASTRGYDEFLTKQVSVVSEKRRYSKFEKNSHEKHFENYKNEGFVYVAINFSNDGMQKMNFVDVKGEWDNWAEFHSLEQKNENNFEIVLKFPNEFIGREFAYKFVIDKKNWIHDWKQPFKKYGNNINNFIKVGENSNTRTGIFETMRPARAVLNKLHTKMSEENYSEMYVHQCNNDLIMIIRQNPETGSSYVLLSRSSYWEDNNSLAESNIKLPGIISELVFLAVLSFKSKSTAEDTQFIRGTKGFLEVFTNFQEFGNFYRNTDENIDVVNLTKVPQGFVCVFKTELFSASHITSINKMCENIAEDPSGFLNGITLEEMNHLLWRCSEEELDVSHKQRDVYEIPRYRKMNYAGIGSLAVEFLLLLDKNNLGSQICNNIREGDWLINYIHSRLPPFVPSSISERIREGLDHIKKLPRGIIPKHLVKFILVLFEASKKYQINYLFDIHPVTRLEEYLYASVSQFWGKVPSVESRLYTCTLSAGLPFFSTGFMRVWGRDTFIAFTGLLLCTHRWAEAKSLLLAFAAVLRHGLIPNLLDSGKNCRYNSRDSTWFFMNSIKNYVEMAPEGENILSESVTMVFKSDNQEEHLRSASEIRLTLSEIVQKIMQAHAFGINYREWNAGPNIDAHMRDEGFNVRIKVNKDTGFVHGGNKWNCGTWMDKMGSSFKAGNAGVPATPRNGAPVELTALLYSSLCFLIEMRQKGTFQFDGVSLEDGTFWRYEEWKQKIEENFEKFYFIRENPENLSGYYKDTLGGEGDLQLRPNFCVAMAVAPKLFEREHAKKALKVVRNELMPGLGGKQLGIRTLNDADLAYRGFYDNGNDSTDASVAHGFSYHNGPEWLWPVGFYFMAVLEFLGDKDLILKGLTPFYYAITNSLWMSLPELTNKSGNECTYSCKAQAWSIAPLIELMQKMNKIS